MTMNAFGAVAPSKYSAISLSYRPGSVLNSRFLALLDPSSKLPIRKPSAGAFASLPMDPILNMIQSLFRRVS